MIMRLERNRFWLFPPIPVLALFTTGPANQSALSPAADQAGEIGRLWWLFCIVLSIIYALVLGFAVAAISRRYRGQAFPILAPDPARERRMAVVVSILVII